MYSYHDSVPANTQELDDYEKKASTQDAVVLQVFRKNPFRAFTPFEVHAIAGLNCPLTSIRRSITNLTKKGLLIKVKPRQKERYGRENRMWTAVIHCSQQKLM